MKNYLMFGGKNLDEFEVYISGGGTYNSPAKVYSTVSIPGRSGDLYIDEKRFQNIEVTYPAFIFKDMKENMQALRSYLLSRTGYQRIEDTYHPDEYRMGVFRKALEVSVDPSHELSMFNLIFECKPQRFLKLGDFRVSYNSSSVIYNPTEFESKPWIRIYGTGSAIIGDTTITISSADSYTDIDCELMDAYKDTISKNAYVSMSTPDFPVLKPGENAVGLGPGITRILIAPRWYMI